MEGTTIRKRIDWIDYFKGFILVTVCLNHLVPYGTYTKEILDLFNPTAMACFFFISGLLFNARSHKTFRFYFISKTKSLFIPYILLSFLFVIIDPCLYSDAYILKFSPDNYREFEVVNSCIPTSIHPGMSYIILQVERIFLFGLSSSIILPMWFVFTLYCVCILFYLIQKNKYIKYSSVILFVAIDVLLIKRNLLLPFNFSVTLSALLFFFLGNEFKLYIHDYLYKYTTKNLCLLSIMFGVSYFLLVSQCKMVDFRINQFGENFIIFSLSSLFGITFFIHFFYLLSKIKTQRMIKKILVTISQNALIILPVHFYINVCCLLLIEPLVPHYRLFALINVVISIILTIIAIPLFRGPLHFIIMKERCSFTDIYNP